MDLTIVRHHAGGFQRVEDRFDRGNLVLGCIVEGVQAVLFVDIAIVRGGRRRLRLENVTVALVVFL